MILGAVRDHAVHGYALVEALAQGLGRGLGLKRPNVYALLYRLEEKGLVHHESKKDSPYPERRIYRATKKGRDEIAALVRACATSSIGATVPLGIVLAYLDDLSSDEQREVLEACREALERALAGIQELTDHHHPGPAGVALDLIRQHYEVDLRAVTKLLRTTMTVTA